MLKSESGMSPAWKAEALRLRTALDQLGVHTPKCLPGEPEDCGSDYVHHCLGYLAAIKARSDVELEHIHHGEPTGVDMADRLYAHWHQQFVAQYDNH